VVVANFMFLLGMQWNTELILESNVNE